MSSILQLLQILQFKTFMKIDFHNKQKKTKINKNTKTKTAYSTAYSFHVNRLGSAHLF